MIMELPSGLEPPNLLITNEVLYRLSYGSTPYIELYSTGAGFTTLNFPISKDNR